MTLWRGNRDLDASTSFSMKIEARGYSRSSARWSYRGIADWRGAALFRLATRVDEIV